MMVLHELLFVVFSVLEQRVGHGRAEIDLHRLLQLGQDALLYRRGDGVVKEGVHRYDGRRLGVCLRPGDLYQEGFGVAVFTYPILK